MTAQAEKVVRQVEERLSQIARKLRRPPTVDFEAVKAAFETVRAAITSTDPRALSDLFEQSEWNAYLQQLPFEDLETLVALLDAKQARFTLAVTTPSPTTQPALDDSPPGSVVAAQAEEPKPQIESCEVIPDAKPETKDEPDRFELLELRRNPGDPPVMPPGSRTYGSIEEWDPYERYQQ